MFKLTETRTSTFHAALDKLCFPDETHISLPFFTSDEIDQMKEEVADLSFRPASAVVGNQVHQDMNVCFPAPRQNAYDACASLLEEGVNSWDKAPTYLGKKLHLNDFAVQHYHEGSKGIGIHKDGLRYKFLVFIITLDGQSRLFHTADRSGTERIAIDDRPGRLVMLKAPDFAGFEADKRVLHGVDQITSGRLSIGFRHEVLSPHS